MIDIVRRISDFNAGRDPERLALKYRNMSASPFVFLRGTCHLFYQRLAASGMPRKVPITWVCGDLHFENFGSFKGDNRLVYFDMNDFDEAVLAPCTWDLVRFLASIGVGAQTLGLKPAEAALLCRVFLSGYAKALADGKALWVERETTNGMVKELLTSLQDRPRPAYLDSRTERCGKQRTIRVDGRKALPVGTKQRRKVTAFIDRFAATQPDPEFFRVQDVARRIAGNGSLGVDRYVILVVGKGSPDRNYLLDLKEATSSALLPYLDVVQPRWRNDAERVVTIQRRMQAVSMAFLQAVTLGKKSYILRALQPSEDRVALARWDGELSRAEGVMRVMGEVAAWGQLRSGGRSGSAGADELVEFARREKWQARLLEAAEHMSAQVVRDWRLYVAAYQDGAFTP